MDGLGPQRSVIHPATNGMKQAMMRDTDKSWLASSRLKPWEPYAGNSIRHVITSPAVLTLA